MKKQQWIAAGLALLLTAGLTACSSTPSTTTSNDTANTTANDTADNQNTAADTNGAANGADTLEPEVTVIEQSDRLTVAEDTPWLYTLAEVAEIGEDGRYRMRVLHDYTVGESIDFTQVDLSQQSYTGEEFYLEPNEQVIFFQRSGDSWASGDLADLKAGSCVYLTCDPNSTEVYAITETDASGTPQEAAADTGDTAETSDTAGDTAQP